MKTINILLFGESVLEKYATINALANYLHFSSFDAAEVGQFFKVYPSGNSVTQSPIVNYEFQYSDKRICIMRTGKMSNTGGLDVNKQNFRNIFDHLKTIEELHGILVLIENCTKNKTLNYISEFFIHLPRNASNNIMFCFTCSENSLFGLGDGYEMLKEFLKENKLGFEQINLKNGENCFFIQNTVFQNFLATKNKDVKLTEVEKKSYQESWEKSVQQSFDMINRIVIDFKPIKVETIFALKDCQKLVKGLVNPIEDLKTKIEEQTNDEQTKGTKRYRENLGNNFDQTSFKLVKELEFIRGCVRKLIEFLVNNLNTNCHNLIEPYLSLYEDDGTEKLSIITPSPFKRAKLSNEVGISTNSILKIENIIVHIRNKSYEIVDLDFFKVIKQKLLDLTYSGNQIREILKIEERIVKQIEKQMENRIEINNLSRVSNEVAETFKQYNKPIKPKMCDLFTSYHASNVINKQFDTVNFRSYLTRPPEIRPTQTINRNVPNQTENNTDNFTVDINSNQFAESFSVRTEHSSNNPVAVVESEHLIPPEDNNLMPTTSRH